MGPCALIMPPEGSVPLDQSGLEGDGLLFSPIAEKKLVRSDMTKNSAQLFFSEEVFHVVAQGKGSRRWAPSSVPENHDERAEEHMEAGTIGRHQAVTMQDCREMRTAQLLFEQKSGLERKKKQQNAEHHWPQHLRFPAPSLVVVADWRLQHSVHIVRQVVAAGLSPISFAFPNRALELSSVSPVGLLPSASELSDSSSPVHVPKLLRMP